VVWRRFVDAERVFIAATNGFGVLRVRVVVAAENINRTYAIRVLVYYTENGELHSLRSNPSNVANGCAGRFGLELGTAHPFCLFR
jgi:hypothetical protein